MAGRSSRRNRRRKNRRNINTKPWMIGLIAGTALCALISGSVLVYDDMQTAKADKHGCYPVAGARAQTMVLVDSSDPGFDPVQSRDLINGLASDFQFKLGFNEEFSVVTTQESRIGSIAAPVVTLCGPAKSQSDLERVGAASTTQAFILRQAEQVWTSKLLPVLHDVFSPSPPIQDRQRHESPLLEQVQSISRMPEFANAQQRRLIVVSDMLHNTEERQFCQTKGHLPSFAKFKTSGYFDKVRPVSLSGVEMTVYMLIRGPLGKKPLQYCTEDELSRFWRDYAEDAGVSSIEFIRIRQGAYAARQ